MKSKRKLFGIVLLGMFVAYFSASFIFVPKAAPLNDTDPQIVQVVNGEDNASQNLLRSSTESSEECIKLLNSFEISFIEDFHTGALETQLSALIENSKQTSYDRFLSLRKLQI